MGLTRYATDRPLLLWTDFPPDSGGGGAVILRSLVSAEDRQRIVWASPAASTGDDTRTVAWLRAGSSGRTRRRSLLLDSTLLARSLADETLRVAQERGARAIWIVLHGAGVPVAAELARRGRLPVHATVHDDPAFAVAMRSRRYLALTPWIESKLARALRGAASVDVISEGMAERYRRRFGVQSHVIHRGVPGPVAPSPEYDAAANGLRVAVLGNTYDYAPLPVLGRAIARAASEHGVRARLTFIGRGMAERLRKDLASVDGLDIEATGHVSEPEAVRTLQGCFALYLNYPFARRDAVLRSTSFPTKLSTYVLAARPVVTHAPGDSTLAPLGSYAGYVHGWTGMDEASGAALFARMWSDPSLRASAHVAADQVRARFFDPAKNERALHGALDALVSPLTAPRTEERSSRSDRS